MRNQKIGKLAPQLASHEGKRKVGHPKHKLAPPKWQKIAQMPDYLVEEHPELV